MIFYELNKQQKVVGIVSSAIVEATLEEAINTAGKLKFTTSFKLRDDCYYILFKRPNAETYMCFKILTETQNNNQVEYTAVESAYDELASYSYIKDIRPQNHSAKEMLTQILSVTRYQVGYVADTPGKTTNFYYKSVLESLQELTNLFGLEITFDVVFDANDNQIKRRLVNLYQQQGNRTGKRFEYGDKLLSVTKEQSSEELVTALVGRGSSVQVSEGSDGSPDGYSRKITFADIEWKKASGNPLDKPLGQEFLEDPSATALYGFSDGKPRIGIVEFSNIKDKNELIQATYEKLQELKRPKVSFKAAVTDVGDLALGDTVAIIRHDLQIEYLTRVYKVTHNLLNEQDNTVEFGDSFQSASITNKLSNIQQDVQSARERSESAVQAANEKNTNFYSSSKPGSAIEGDLWYKDLGNGETELYAWHNGNWELVVSTADTTAVKRQVEQAQADLEQVRADANRISETQTESAKRLDEQMQELRAKTVDNATNVQNVIRDVAQAHTDYVNQQADISKQKADLEKARQDLLANSESIESFKGKVSKFQVDLDGINSQVVSNTGAINQFKVTENDINQAMKDAQGNIETLKLTAKSFEQKFADTDGNIASVKRSATELSEQLASKVGNTEYQSFKTQTAKELSQKLVRSDLNGYATTAEVKLTADGLNARFDNLNVGGTNMLYKTKDIDSTVWVQKGKAYYDTKLGEKAIHAWGDWSTYVSNQTIHLESNTDYTISASLLSYQVGTGGVDGSGITFGVYAKNTADNQVFSLGTLNGTKGNLSNTEWKRFSTVYHNTSAKDITDFRIEASGDWSTVSGNVWIAKMKLEDGNVPTPWSPAFEDIDDKFEGLSSRISTNSAQFSSVYTKIDNAKTDAEKAAINAIKGDSNWQKMGKIVTNASFLQTADGFAQEVVKEAKPMIGGGKNLARGTSDSWQGVRTNEFSGTTNFIKPVATVYLDDLSVGDKVTVQIIYQYSKLTATNAQCWLQGYGNVTGWTGGNFYGSPTMVNMQPGTDLKSGSKKYTFDITADMKKNRYWSITYRFDNVNQGTWFQWIKFKVEKGTVATPWSPAPEDLATVVSVNKVIDTADSHTQIIKDYLTNDNSQFKLLKNAVNLKVEKGDVIGQINLEAGKTLLQNKKIYLDADTVAFSGKAFIPSAAITELSADKITTGTLNAAAVKVINLDASKITTGTLTGPSLKLDLKTGEVLFSKGRITGPGLDMDLSTGTINFNQGRLHDYSNNIDISIDDSYISSSDGRGRVVMRSGRLFFTESSLWDESREPYLVIQNGINGMIDDGANINARKAISITNSSSTGFTPDFPIGQFGFSGFYVGQAMDRWIPTVVGGQNRGVYISGGQPYGQYVPTTPSILVGCNSQGETLCDSGWKDGTRIYLKGNFVHIPSAQYQTTSAGANVHVANDGALVRSTSAAKYKTNIVDATGFNYGDKLINLTPKLWLDKAEQKRYQDDPENNPRPNFYYGLIADELSKEGLSKLVVYNSEGEVEGINYDRIAVALLPVIKKLKDKIKILEEKINE